MTTGRRPSRWSTRSPPPAARPWPTPTTSADWEGGKRLIDTAVEAFGDLHVLVNNAGILRDRVLVNMSEADWDSVVHVHLKGHFVPTRHAAAYWRRADQGGQGGQGVGDQHLVDLGPARQPGPVQLRGGQGRHRRLHRHRRRGAGPLRRAGQRHRPGRPDPDDRADPGSVRHRPGPARRRRVRQLGPGQHLAPGGLPGHRVAARPPAGCSSSRAARSACSSRGP